MKLGKSCLIGTLAVVVGIGSGGIPPAYATDLETGNSVLLPAGRAVKDDVAAFGNSVQMQSRVTGDVAAVANDMTLGGPVSADADLIGSNITTTGPIGDDLRACGATVDILGPVANNVLIAGGTITVGKGAAIGHDADIAGGEITVEAPVKGDLRVSGGEVTVSSEVQGNVVANVRRLTLEPDAIVHGDVTANSQEPPVISPQAHVAGRVHYRYTLGPSGAGDGSAPPQDPWFGWWIFRFLSTVVTGGILAALFPGLASRIDGTLRARPAASIAAGSVALAGIPIAAAILMCTVIGIPTAFLMIAAYAMLLLTSGALLAIPLGDSLLRSAHRDPATMSPYVRLILGALTIATAIAIPVVGGLAYLAILLAGPGALIAWAMESRRGRSGTVAVAENNR